jgi:hypothetical protein
MDKKRIDEKRAIELLKQALSETPHLKELRYDNQEFILWFDRVQDIIQAGLDENDRQRFPSSRKVTITTSGNLPSDDDFQRYHLIMLNHCETALKSIIQKYETLAKEAIHSEVAKPQKSSVTREEKTPKEKIDQLEQFLEELEKFRELQIFMADIHQDDPKVDKLRTKLVRESTQIREIVWPPDGRLFFEHRGVVFDAFDTAFTKPVPPWSLTTQWHCSVNLLIQKANEAIGRLERVSTPELLKEAVYPSDTPYDAYKDIKEIIILATKKLTIVDMWVDSSVVSLLENVHHGVEVQVLTHHMQGDFKLAVQKFKEQREIARQGSLEVRQDKGDFHDRFIVADDNFFHLGASIKDAGTKVFAINKIEDPRNKSVLMENILKAWDAAEKVL